jgi:hypothetical protein
MARGSESETERDRYFFVSRPSSATLPYLFALASLVFASQACRNTRFDPQRVLPRQLRDVPAQRLAYRFEPDIQPPPGADSEQTSSKLAPIQDDFNAHRKDEALLRTVVSPDGLRALALYATADEPSENFKIDLYAADGKFLRNLTPPDLAAAFPESVVWSSDGSLIAFAGRKSLKPEPTPEPPGEEPEIPVASPQPSPSVAPAFAPVRVFDTEQIYLCNRDGFDLKPLTTRVGLIYFALAWAPDNSALAALACKEDEWEARERQSKLPAGRPRLIALDGHERLLDDALAESSPVWSPDSSKVATSFDTDVGVYDATAKTPTQARIPLRDNLIAASSSYDEKMAMQKKKAGDRTSNSQTGQETNLPVSFNPIVRLQWVTPERLYVQTGYVRQMRGEPINTFLRWHLITLSPQAMLL